MKLIRVLAALAVFLAAPAFASVDDEDIPKEPGGSIYGGGIEQDYSPGTDRWSGDPCRPGFVCVIGDKLIMEHTLIPPNAEGTGWIFVGTTGRATQRGDRVEPQTPEQKAQCLANCETQKKVATNVCVMQNMKLAGSMSIVPYVGAAIGGVAGTFVLRNALGSIGGFVGGYAMATAERDRIVEQHRRTCEALVASNDNFCITQTCHAWAWLLGLLWVRRRDEDEEEARLAFLT